MSNLKVLQCTGEGSGYCRRCYELKGWNSIWMCFLYKIEGYEGCYCSACVKEILKKGECFMQGNVNLSTNENGKFSQ